MAKNLSNDGIVLNQTIYPQHVSQSVDAFTGADDYDITISGSFTVTGSTAIQGDVNVDGPITMYGNVVAPNLTSTAQSDVVTYNPINGQLYYTASSAISPATASNAVSASYSATASYAEYAVSTSYADTASWAINAITASYVTTAQTASYVLNAVSASYASTASYVANAQTASYVTLAQTASYVTTAQTASYVLSASYAVSSSTANSAISASYSTTASFAQDAISSSYAVSASHADLADTASYVTLAQTASYVLSASYAVTSSYSNTSTSASYALTASYLEGYISPFPFTGSAQITGSLGVTGSVDIYKSGSSILTISGSSGPILEVTDTVSGSLWTIYTGSSVIFDVSSDRTMTLNGSANITGSATVNGNLVVNGTASFNVFHTIYNSSSIIYASGSTKFGDTSDDTHEFTGSLLVSGSVTADSFTGTASYATQAATASFVTTAQTASYVANAQTASFVTLAQTASYVATASYSNSSLSASYALTASHVTGIVAAFPYTGSAQITGSLSVTGSVNIYKSGSTVLAVSGSTGPLMSITDSISGPLLTVATGSTNILVVDSSLVTTITGSLNVQSGITGSLFGTASWALNSATASFVTTAQTASYVLNAVSASYVNTASYALNAMSASYAVTASYATSALSASHAETSSLSDRTFQTDILVINQTGFTIDKGMVVRITGSNNSSDVPRITTASYESDNVSANTLGIATQQITNGSQGFVITEGILLGIDTSLYNSGQLLFLGASGAITGSAPQAPLHTVRLGQVIRQQSNQGSMHVRIDNGYELGEMHDMIDTTTTSSYGDLLVKSGSVWVNSKQLTGSYGVTGSISATSFTGSLFGTASYATQAATASYVVLAQTASFVTTAQTASYVLNAVSSSFASTASYVNQLNQTVNISGSLFATGSVNIYESGSSPLVISGSQGALFEVTDSNSGSLWTIYTGSSPIFDVSSDRVMTLSGSAVITGSLTVQNGITGSLFGTASTASFVTTAQTASYVLNAVSSSFASTASFVALAQTASYVVLAQTASYVLNAVSSSFAATASYVNQLNQAVLISGSINATGSVNVYKSGSTVFAVSGSAGPLFDVSDVVSGSLFTVWTGSIPILQANSDYTTILGGASDAAALFATNKTTANSGSTTLYTVPTATYDSIHIDYNIRSGSVARAGNLLAMWSGSDVNQIETSASSFGDTSGFTFGVIVSGSNLALTGSVSTSGWTVKTIIRSI